MPVPDDAAFADKQEELAELRERHQCEARRVRRASRSCRASNSERREVLAEVQHAQKERAEANARRIALQQLQQRLQTNGKLDDWLRRHGLQQGQPLWKSLHVEAGWEDAVEAILRERLSALPAERADPAWSRDRPGGKLTLLLPLAGASPSAGNCRRVAAGANRCDDPSLRRFSATGWATC
jgi:chromosome segregation protein